MSPDRHEQVASNFRANLERVTSLVDASDTLGTPGRGAPSIQQTDVLRTAVVLLHASFEDLLRSSSEHLLPQAGPEVLDWVGFPDPNDPNKTRDRLTMGQLAAYRGRPFDDLVRTAVQRKLKRSNYNSVHELAISLERIGLSRDLLEPYQSALQTMMKRRHLIVHRADKDPTRVPGRGARRTAHLSESTVERWIDAVSTVGDNIVEALSSVE